MSTRPHETSPEALTSRVEVGATPYADELAAFVARRQNVLFTLSPELVQAITKEAILQNQTVETYLLATLTRAGLTTCQVGEPKNYGDKRCYVNLNTPYISEDTYEQVDMWERMIRSDEANGQKVFVVSLFPPDSDAFLDADRRWFNGPFSYERGTSTVRQLYPSGKSIDDKQLTLVRNATTRVWSWEDSTAET